MLPDPEHELNPDVYRAPFPEGAATPEPEADPEPESAPEPEPEIGETDGSV